jgi:hypothetical protein
MMGKNSLRRDSPWMKRRSSLRNPRQDRRAATMVITEAPSTSRPKAMSKKAPGLGLAPLDEGQVVHEYQEPGCCFFIVHQGHRADVNVAAGQAPHRIPRPGGLIENAAFARLSAMRLPMAAQEICGGRSGERASISMRRCMRPRP